MCKENTSMFYKGMRDGTPLLLGYLAVAFTLGLGAKSCGLSPVQAIISAVTQNAAAGQFAGYSLISSGAGYLEVAVMILVANARYLLMSCTLSQKISPDTPLRHRLCLAVDITDEIFGLAAAQPRRLNPFYNYGLVVAAAPGWAVGTYLGAAAGSVLSAPVMTALSVSLFGMFIAVIVPPARKDKIVAVLIIISMASSFAFAKFNMLGISAGGRTLILTVAISAAAAYLFPLKETVLARETEPLCESAEETQLHAA
ncbi:MAG: AzlC family ABC transporter permease [Cloacibacillus sp.]